jgi:hypothetical protein
MPHGTHACAVLAADPAANVMLDAELSAAVADVSR